MSTGSPRVVAFGDVHAPIYVNYLSSSLAKLQPDAKLVLVAGDVVARGEWRMCRQVSELIEKFLPGAIVVGVFGNEDYEEARGRIREECSGFMWLEDGAVEVDVYGLRVRIVGSTGVLDEPTPWQKRNVPGIVDTYRRRLERLGELLNKKSGDLTILLTHYPPRCRTLMGEDERFWRQMSSEGLAELVKKKGVDIVVHGHLHRSTVHRDYIGNTPVYNVALPATKSVTVIELRRQGLLQFL